MSREHPNAQRRRSQATRIGVTSLRHRWAPSRGRRAALFWTGLPLLLASAGVLWSSRDTDGIDGRPKAAAPEGTLAAAKDEHQGPRPMGLSRIAGGLTIETRPKEGAPAQGITREVPSEVRYITCAQRALPEGLSLEEFSASIAWDEIAEAQQEGRWSELLGIDPDGSSLEGDPPLRRRSRWVVATDPDRAACPVLLAPSGPPRVSGREPLKIVIEPEERLASASLQLECRAILEDEERMGLAWAAVLPPERRDPSTWVLPPFDGLLEVRATGAGRGAVWRGHVQREGGCTITMSLEGTFSLRARVEPAELVHSGLEVVVHRPGSPWASALGRSAVEESGDCTIEPLFARPGERLTATLIGPGLAQREATWRAPEPGGLVEIALQASPSSPHVVQLLRAGDGSPVGNAEVIAFWSGGDSKHRSEALVRTDRNGLAHFERLPSGPVWFQVASGRWSAPPTLRVAEHGFGPGTDSDHGDGPEASPRGAKQAGTVLLVRPAGILEGRWVLEGQTKQELSGLRIRAVDGSGGQHHLRAERLPEQRYRIQGLPAGTLQLLAVAEPSGATSRPLTLDLPAAMTVEQELILSETVLVSGRVVEASSGAPIAEAEVTCDLQLAGEWIAGDAANARSTDPWGRFEGLRMPSSGGIVRVTSQAHLQLARVVPAPISSQVDVGDLPMEDVQVVRLALHPIPPNPSQWSLEQDPPLTFDHEGILEVAAGPGPLQVVVQPPGRAGILVEASLAGAGPWNVRVPTGGEALDPLRFRLVGPNGAPFIHGTRHATAVRITRDDSLARASFVEHAQLDRDGSSTIEVPGLPPELLTVCVVHAGLEGPLTVVDASSDRLSTIDLVVPQTWEEVSLVDGSAEPLADFDAWLLPSGTAPAHHVMTDSRGRLSHGHWQDGVALLVADPVTRRLGSTTERNPAGVVTIPMEDELELIVRRRGSPVGGANLLLGLDARPSCASIALRSDEAGRTPAVLHSGHALWVHLLDPAVWRPTRQIPSGTGREVVLDLRRLTTLAIQVQRSDGSPLSSPPPLALTHLELGECLSDWVESGLVDEPLMAEAPTRLLVRGIPEGPYEIEVLGVRQELDIRSGATNTAYVLIP